MTFWMYVGYTVWIVIVCGTIYDCVRLIAKALENRNRRE